MDLATWISKLPRKIWFQKRSTSGFFLDEQSLRLEMARERMRVDRNGSPLAILTIDLPAARSKPRDFDFLGRVFAGRLRITDTIGFLSTKQVGVLLPDTSKSGAWKVATDVCAVYPPGHDRPNCDVFTYPDDSNDKRWANSDSSDQQELPTHESGEAVLDRFIAFRTPTSKRVDRHLRREPGSARVRTDAVCDCHRHQAYVSRTGVLFARTRRIGRTPVPHL